MQPKISVIMPVYNGAMTIEAAVDSVLAQSFRNFELIVCDDASTDNTLNILERITDERLHVLSNKFNRGEGGARDHAIDVATGDWLAFIDADDAWAPERLDVLLNYCDNPPNSIIFDDIMECHDTSSGLIPWRAMRGRNAFDCDNDIGYTDLAAASLLMSNRLLIKPLIPLKHVKEHNIRHSNRRFGADIEFFIELFSLGLPIRYIPKPMYYYRITPRSMTSLPNRMTLFREVFENAIDKFNYAPDVQLAIYKKIVDICRSELYLPFVLSLKKKQAWNAFQLIRNHPWIINEFLHRLHHSLAYHIHRIRCGGRTRGIR